jgi:hypothetical protein
MAHGFKTGGRKKGSKNRVNRDVEALLDKVFQRVNPVAKLEELLNSDDPRISAGVLLKLMEYRYGKPKERLEISSTKSVRDIIAEARARVASLNTLSGPIKIAEPAPAPAMPQLPPAPEPEVISPEPERDKAEQWRRIKLEGELPIKLQ